MYGDIMKSRTKEQRKQQKEGSEMIAYSIDYTIRGDGKSYTKSVDAKDLKSAKKKIGKKHGYKDGRMVQIEKVLVVGYY